MSAGLYALEYNGTAGVADAGYSSNVTNLNSFYEVSYHRIRDPQRMRSGAPPPALRRFPGGQLAGFVSAPLPRRDHFLEGSWLTLSCAVG